MKKVCLVFILTILVNYLFAQSVATINGLSVNSKEFLWVYKKNHAGETKTNYKDLAAYLNLYINFKLKVAEARALGMHLDSAYQNEIAGYEDALKAQNKLSSKAPEYSYIMNEYREGVLMFNISEQKIWNKVQESENEVKGFYDKNASKYEHKNFEEIRGQVMGDYQQELENNWIKDLRTKYIIKINDAELRKLAKQ